MPKYRNDQEFREPKPNIIGEGINRGVQEAAAIREQQANTAILNDPNATPMQKAIAASKTNPQLGAQILKQGNTSQLLADIQARYGTGQGMNQQVPNSQQMQGNLQQQIAELQNYQPGQAPRQQPPQQIRQPSPDQVQQQQRPRISPGEILETTAVHAPSGKALADIAKMQQKEEHIARQERMQIHKDLQKADNEIHNAAKTARSRQSSFNVMRKNLESGKLNPKSFENVLTTALKGSRWENFYKNKERAEFEAAALSSFEGMKDLFGTRLSDADLRQAAGKIPDPTKSVEANMAIIDFMDFQDKMKVAEEKVGAEIKKENGGFRPLDYQEQIRERMQQLYGNEADEIVKKAAYDGSKIPKFDPSNTDHDARRQQVLQQVGGDKAKANQILAQEFMR